MTDVILYSDRWKAVACEIAISPDGQLTITFDKDDENKWIEIMPDGSAIEHEWIDGAGVITDKPVNLHDMLVRFIEAHHD